VQNVGDKTAKSEAQKVTTAKHWNTEKYRVCQ